MFAFVTIFYLMVVPASATFWNGIEYTSTNFWYSISFQWDKSDSGIEFWKNMLSAFLSDPDNPTAEDLENAYEHYVGTLVNPTISFEGSLNAYPSTFVNMTVVSSLSEISTSAFTSENYSFAVSGYKIFNRYWSDKNPRSFINLYIKVPISGYYYLQYCPYVYAGSTAKIYKWGNSTSSGIYASQTFSSSDYSQSSISTSSVYYDANIIYSFQVSLSQDRSLDTWHEYEYWFRLVPNEAYFNGTVVSVDDSSRPGTFTGLIYGYQDENGDTVIYAPDGSGMFNEDGGYVYNPVTNETYQAIDWTYNYELMAYEITLATGGTSTVTYGPDSMTVTVPDTVVVDGNTYNYNTYVENNTINEGDTINYVTYTYNYYYESSSGGSDVDDSEFVAWWKAQWADFRTWLTSNWGSGSDNSFVPSDPADTVFPGSTNEEDGWSFLDLLVAVKDGAWKVTTGTVGVFFGGVGGIISSVVSVGDFFDAYDSGSPDNIFGIKDYGGADIWD